MGIPYTNYTNDVIFVCLKLQINTFICFVIDRPKTNTYNKDTNKKRDRKEVKRMFIEFCKAIDASGAGDLVRDAAIVLTVAAVVLAAAVVVDLVNHFKK